MTSVLILLALFLGLWPMTALALWVAKRFRKSITAATGVLLLFGVNMGGTPPPPPLIVAESQQEAEEAGDDEPK